MRSRLSVLTLSCLLLSSIPLTTHAQRDGLEEVIVIADQVFNETGVVSPTSTLTAAELALTNMTSTEDAVAFAPSLIVRKRFIGDANGVVGIRGSNMFQTTRSMVFVDGMPLHYHLQTRYRGAPRWSLVSPSEIDQVEVVYGPFSAEYSGNAMGGVINIQTANPRESRGVVEMGYFAQPHRYGDNNDTLDGYRTFASYEDRIGDLGVFLSYNRLDNSGQPQSHFFSSNTTDEPTAEASIGWLEGTDEMGNAGVYFGDSGAESTLAELYKGKFFYPRGRLQWRGSVAYETRRRSEREQNSFIRDADGTPIFDRRVALAGSDRAYDTYAFGRSRFQQREQQRDSFLVGLGVSIEANDDWLGDAFYSNFRVLDDVEVRSGNHPMAPTFVTENQKYRARITTYDDTGWQIFDLKFSNDRWLNDDRQQLSLGLHYDDYRLNYIVDDYNTIAGLRDSDETDGDPSTGRADSGGQANTSAIFAHYGLELTPSWTLDLGLRYEQWRADEGYLGAQRILPRSESAYSPKLSLAWYVNEGLNVRYSVARALRFPVVEELYVNDSQGAGAAAIGDPTLAPEAGVFHNLGFSKFLDDGELRLNLFYEEVDDVIFNQRASNGTSTFLPVGAVITQGTEFIWQQKKLWSLPLDVRFNLTYTDAKITENVFNSNFVGKQFPRSPSWRSHLMLSYKYSPEWAMGATVRYASDSYGTLDNSDTVDRVFGAHDSFVFVATTLNWQISPQLKLTAGIDNLFDQQAYVFHPWPGRTYHFQARYQIGG